MGETEGGHFCPHKKRKEGPSKQLEGEIRGGPGYMEATPVHPACANLLHHSPCATCFPLKYLL